jgi:hypothetical protein
MFSLSLTPGSNKVTYFDSLHFLTPSIVIIDIVQVTAEEGAFPDEFSNRQSFSYP